MFWTDWFIARRCCYLSLFFYFLLRPSWKIDGCVLLHGFSGGNCLVSGDVVFSGLRVVVSFVVTPDYIVETRPRIVIRLEFFSGN